MLYSRRRNNELMWCTAKSRCRCHCCHSLCSDESSDLESLNLSNKKRSVNDADFSLLPENPNLLLTDDNQVAQVCFIPTQSPVTEEDSAKCQTKLSLLHRNTVVRFVNVIRNIGFGNYIREWVEFFFRGIYERIVKRFW